MTNKHTEIDFPINIIDEIKEKLISKKLTLSIAESVTGGFLQAAFTQTKDASKFFHGGITVYNNGQKVRHLNMDAILVENNNGVSKQIAEDMAISVAEKFTSTIGLAVTGYAAQMPENNIYSTFAWMAIAKGKKLVVSKKILAKNIDEGKDTQLHFVSKILTALNEVLK